MTRLKASPVIFHIAAWLLFMSFPLLFMNQGKSISGISTPGFYYLQFCLVYIIIFYVHTYWLIPKYVLRKNYLMYSVALFSLFALVYYVKPFDDLVSRNRMPPSQKPPPNSDYRKMPPPPPHDEQMRKSTSEQFDITSSFIFIMVIGLGTALQSIKQWQLSEKRALLAETEKANAELSFLKAQINPHFLYNTLNNIYTLCLIDSENAANSIMKLSNIMRYVTDESDSDFVPLEDEVQCISDFIALQKLRLGKKVSLSYTIEGDIVKHRIAPLILMTFVENVFKYGLSNHIDSKIELLIKTENEKITFLSRNQIFKHKKINDRKSIGLENTKKRLAYLYENEHNLSITNDGEFFTVLLVLRSK